MKTIWISIEHWTNIRTLSTMETDPDDVDIFDSLVEALKAWEDKKEWRASKPFSDVEELFRRERDEKDRITKRYLYKLEDENYIIQTDIFEKEIFNDKED